MQGSHTTRQVRKTYYKMSRWSMRPQDIKPQEVSVELVICRGVLPKETAGGGGVGGNSKSPKFSPPSGIMG